MNISMEQLLQAVVENDCSDLKLLGDDIPKIRKDADLRPLDLPELSTDNVKLIMYSIINDVQKKEFEENKELDFSVDIPDVGARFRANYHYAQGKMGASFRIIPAEIPSLEDLKSPAILKKFSELKKGLVLVTGPTGSGKSTTMAAMVNEINENEKRHILTIEDPVEFLHKNKVATFTQREVGTDTKSFKEALKRALRQDPDVILVGEMRDLETIRLAIEASETGHLVIGTLHTKSAPATVTRIINVFPEGEQSLIRTQLSMTLKGVVSQALIPKIGGGRVAVQEILNVTPAIANLMRDEKKFSQIPSQMEMNQNVTKMQTQKQELVKLVEKGIISVDNALKYADNRDELEKMIKTNVDTSATGGGGTDNTDKKPKKEIKTSFFS